MGLLIGLFAADFPRPAVCTRAELLPVPAFLADSAGAFCAGLSAGLSLDGGSLAPAPSPPLASLPFASLPLPSAPAAAASLPPSLTASLAPSLGASDSGRSARLRLLS